MNKIFTAIFMLLSLTKIHANSPAINFIVCPVTIMFPTISKEMMENQDAKFEPDILKYTVFGNFSKGERIKIYPQKNKTSKITPFAVMEEILNIYSSKDYNRILDLVDKNISESAMQFYKDQLTHPLFSKFVSEHKFYIIQGYYLYGARNCIVVYNVNDEKPSFRFIFNFVDGQWYLGDQMNEIGEIGKWLSAFYSVFGDNNAEEMHITSPARLEDLIELSRDTIGVETYNILSKQYNWPNFSEYIK